MHWGNDAQRCKKVFLPIQAKGINNQSIKGENVKENKFTYKFRRE
jgi:hypothetical protein